MSGSLAPEYEYRHRRMVITIVIFIYNYRVFPRRELSEECKDRLLLLESRIFSAVDAQTHHTAVFQDAKPFLDCFHAGCGSSCNLMAAAGFGLIIRFLTEFVKEKEKRQ